MFGAVVLRDIPKEEVRIDLARLAIQGGFRGFSQVPPAAWHYVSVKDGAHDAGFWFWLTPAEAVVRVYADGGFVEDTPDSVATFSQLALSGAMGPALLPYPHETFGPWYGLVMHIPREDFPPTIHRQDRGDGTRFETALTGTHGGAAAAFLAEFQYAFVAWLISQSGATEDAAAFQRWRDLLLGIYNAGERRIAANGELFGHLVDTLLRQYALLPDDWFGGSSFLVAEAGYLAEDLQDCGLPALEEKGRALASYLKSRQT